MLEDLKRRVWTIAVTVLALMFSILVPVAIKCSEYADMVDQWNVTQVKRMTENIVDLLGVNGFAITLLMAAAVLWAVSGFQYLHNGRKVDFYHSIPVKRHVLFITRYVNGILVPAVMYLIFLVPSVILAYRIGVDTEAIGMIPWQVFGMNMVYYSLLYTVTVIAMMLTGSIVVALLGTCVFCGYVPAVTWLIRCYYDLWFHTYYETEESLQGFYQVIRYSSPISNYMYTVYDYIEGKPVLGCVIGAAVVTMILAAIAYLLYRKRASEAAGKAMAFYKTRMPIKVLMVIPMALASGMIFFELRDTIAWLIFGTVCGVVLVHCTMEIIYHFDFRRLFTNKLHLTGCLAVSVVLSLAGYYDWYGYDSWLPDEGNIQDAAVISGYLDHWVTYGKPSAPNENSGYIYWEYEGSNAYQLREMHLTDIYSVMEIAKRGVEAEVRWGAKEQSSIDQISFIVQYRMTDGKIAIRRYSIPMDDNMWAVYDAIHDSAEYKRGTYPILSQTAAQTVEVYYQQYNQIKALDLDHEEAAYFLEVYQKEWEKLTMDTRRKELPIATIQFRTREMQDAINHNMAYDHNSGDLSNRCYYPIYPSFIRTLELLEQKGIVPGKLDEQTLSTIQLYYRDEYWAKEYDVELTGLEGITKTFTEAEDLQALGQALVYQDYHNMNSFYQVDMIDNADASASFRHETEANKHAEMYGVTDERYYGFYLDANALSEELMEKYDLINLDENARRDELTEVVRVEVNSAPTWY